MSKGCLFGSFCGLTLGIFLGRHPPPPCSGPLLTHSLVQMTHHLVDHQLLHLVACPTQPFCVGSAHLQMGPLGEGLPNSLSPATGWVHTQPLGEPQQQRPPPLQPRSSRSRAVFGSPSWLLTRLVFQASQAPFLVAFQFNAGAPVNLSERFSPGPPPLARKAGGSFQNSNSPLPLWC